MDKESSGYNKFLLETLMESLKRSIISQSSAQLTAFNEGLLNDLSDFLERNGAAKEWVRARCLESAIASIGLEEYLSTALGFRGSSPSKTAPVNMMFASNQIIRVLDPIALRLLEEKSQKNKRVNKEKWNALLSVLKPDRNFTINRPDVYLDVDDIGYLRNLLLEAAIDKLQFTSDYFLTSKNMVSRPILEFLEELPEISFDKLLEVSKLTPNLKIRVEQGVIKWTYAQQPTIYIYENRAFFDLRELKLENISLNVVKRQLYLVKKSLFSKNVKQHPKREPKTGNTSEDKTVEVKADANKKSD